MAWNEIGTWVINQPETIIPSTFTSRLAIRVTAPSRLKPTWYTAGFFYSYLDLPGLGLVRIEDKFNVALQEPCLLIPSVFKPSYTLKFFKVSWIDQLTLTIYEDEMQLSYFPDLGTIPNPNASTTNTVIVPISATSVSLLPANTNRKKVLITNTGNQDLRIDLDATASLADFSAVIPKVPANGIPATLEIEEYTGVISGIWTAAGTGAALIKEMVG